VFFRKFTNAFRTEWGARLYADIRSAIETVRRRAIRAKAAIRLSLAGPLPVAAWLAGEQLRVHEIRFFEKVAATMKH
jgi:hypothetical protein